jgi:hypothetical protein
MPYTDHGILLAPFRHIRGRKYLLRGELYLFRDQIIAAAAGEAAPDPTLPIYADKTLVPAMVAGEAIGVGRRTLGRLELAGRRARAKLSAVSHAGKRAKASATAAAPAG